jgi:signal peptidase I
MARKKLWAAATLVVTVFAATTLALFLIGVRGFIVETPSMGQTAPVGSLVVTAPIESKQVVIGDIITFKPDSAPTEVYTHRVVEVDSKGIHTQGDINGAVDPWALHQANLLGKEFAIFPVMGWVVKALPILSLGFGLVWIGTIYIPAKHLRSALRTLGVSAVAAYTVNLIKPLVSYVVLTQTPTIGGMTSRVVSTGLIPLQFVGKGAPVVLTSGQVGNVQSLADPKTGLVHLTAAMHLDFLGWVIMTVILAIPTVWSLVVGFRNRSAKAAKPTKDSREEQNVEPAQTAMSLLIAKYTSGSDSQNAKHV